MSWISGRAFFPLVVMLAAGCALEESEAGETAGAIRTRTVRLVRPEICVSQPFVADEKFDPDNVDQKLISTRFTEDESQSQVNAYWMAVASAIVYSGKPVVESELSAHWGASRTAWFEKKAPGIDTQAFLAEIKHNPALDIPARRIELEPGFEIDLPETKSVGDMTILAFRGTESSVREDWSTDFTHEFIEFNGLGGASNYYAHKGFTAALDLVWPDVLAQVKRSKGPIFITGHSLGGALATLATLRLMMLDEPNVNVAALYTFGSPRVGDDRFAEIFNKLREKRGVKLRRYVNNNDLVAMIPDRAIGALTGHISQIFSEGWQHVGEGDSADDALVWFTEGRMPYSNAEAKKRMSSNAWMSAIGRSWFKDHSVKRYVWKTEIAAFGKRTLCPGQTNEQSAE